MHNILKLKSVLNLLSVIIISLFISGCSLMVKSIPGSANTDNTKELNKLIKEGNDINGLSSYGAGGIHYAAKAGNIDSLKILLKNGANVNLIAKKKYDGWTPMRFAVTSWKHPHAFHKNKKVEVVNLLIKKGSKLDYKGADGESLLHIAASQTYKGSSKLTEILIKSGLDVNAKDNNGKTPMDYATEKFAFSNIIVLMKNGVKFNDYVGENGSNLFHLAASQVVKNKNAYTLIDYLVANGNDINMPDNDKRTVLHYVYNYELDNRNSRAIKAELIAITKLMKRGAKLFAQDKDGNTIGHYAASQGRYYIVGIYQGIFKKYNLKDVLNNKGQTINGLYIDYVNWVKDMENPKTMTFRSPPSCI